MLRASLPDQRFWNKPISSLSECCGILWERFNMAFFSPPKWWNIQKHCFAGPFDSGICPKYCCAHLLGGDSDDSIKHMNGESCHVDVAEHWRLMILNQRGAALTGTVGVPAERLQLLICLRMALYDFKGTITVRWRDVFYFPIVSRQRAVCVVR